MAKLAVHGPFDKPDLHLDFRPHPVCAHTRQTNSTRERWFLDLQLVELRTQIQQQLRIESGSNLSGKNEIVIFEVTNKKRAQTDSLPLRIRKPTDEKILRQLAFHLEPLLRTTMFVDRTAPLRNDAFPTFLPRELPRRWIIDQSYSMKWLLKRQTGQEFSTFLERQCGYISSVDPHDVENVISDFAAAPRDLAVENEFFVWQTLYHLLNRRQMPRELIS